MIRQTVLFGSLLSISQTLLLFSNIAPERQERKKVIVQVSIPKTGTNLLLKCIKLLTNHSTYSGIPDWNALLNPSGNYLRYTHQIFDDFYADKLSDPRIIKFFMLRDPRDQLISLVFYMQRDKGKQNWPTAQSVPFNDLITQMIGSGYTFYKRLAPVETINEFYRAFLPWQNVQGFYTIRFEDLVGAEGGGSAENQLQEIKNIAQHIGLSLTDSKIQAVASKLYGGTHTFREGAIGAWKKHFTDEHKRLFKEVAGQLLIDLGYEKDFNW